MKDSVLFFIIVLLGILPNNLAKGQNDILNTKTIAITTKNGNKYIGKILNETDKIFSIKTESGQEIEIKKDNIKSIDFDYISGNQAGTESKEGYRNFPSRYIINSSGYNLKKGEWYYSNSMLLLNDLNYGVSNYFSVGVSAIAVFLNDDDPIPLFLKTKLSYPVLKNKINFGGGVIASTELRTNNKSKINMLFYFAGTFGDKNNNFTLGVDYRNSHNDNNFNNTLISLSGKFRITSRTFFITENYFGFDDNSILLINSTFVARSIFKRFALEYGIMTFNRDLQIFNSVLPYLGVKIGFGK